jgi:glycine cleavage system aminomethyltransferase T
MNSAGLDVQIEDVSETVAGLGLQGPLSRDVLERATRQDWKDVRYFGHRRTEIAGVELDVTRTGYTGDLGYELGAGRRRPSVWDAVWDAGQDFRIRPIGIRALDVARVEAGLIMVDAEYTSARHATSTAPDEFYSPFEIGLGRLVDFGKEDFVGKRALELEQAAGGPRRRLVGLHVDWTGIEQMFAKHGLAPAVSPVVDRSPVPLYRQGRRIGRATSITWGITIKKMVAFGSVPPSMSAIGERMHQGPSRRAQQVPPSSPPFWTPAQAGVAPGARNVWDNGPVPRPRLRRRSRSQGVVAPSSRSGASSQRSSPASDRQPGFVLDRTAAGDPDGGVPALLGGSGWQRSAAQSSDGETPRPPIQTPRSSRWPGTSAPSTSSSSADSSTPSARATCSSCSRPTTPRTTRTSPRRS